MVKEECVIFIILDVEGAELKALQGAHNTIIRNYPRLAISVYYKLEDIFEISKYILSLHNDYKLYIRHYQFSECETILYAI
uniref:FkbM family methyltransferase n=1 Tax=Acetatifactor sp. TaxID=1872090 RepID=UPI00405665CD